MPTTHPPRSTVRRSIADTALVTALALVASVLLGVAVASPAQAHEGHGHVLLYNEAPAGPWHDEAIAYGTPKIKEALEAEGLAVTVSSDSSVFTDENLAQYDAMIAFQINGDPWTADEKAAMERWMQAGGGIAAIHNATDMRGSYPWWDNMIGALMPGHSAADIPAVVRNEDVTHPSTDHFHGTEKVSRWMRNDEWYNFNRNVRGEAHVLQTMDESTYNPGGNAQGYDHPITWCKPYDGGRFWSTALGHFPKNYDEPEFMDMIVGGVKYVAGLEDGDCGGTVWDSYERIPLDQNTSAPYAIDVAEDGKVFYTELVRGQLRMYDPESQAVTTVLTLPVYSGGEDGLLGVALDPDFTTNGHLYLYRSAASPNDSDPANFWSTVSRFTFENGSVDPETEKVIIKIPARRLPDEPGHTGGALDIDDDGNLFIGVGDDVNPHSEPSGGYAPLSERAGTFHDARETSANTNDLRGKILRITPVDEPGDEPGAGSTYTIPEGNLFDEAEDEGRDKTLPEIYAMGFRNPFRFSIDSKTGWLSMADYSPDNGSDNPANRGPAGIAEWNLIKTPGNYGWPMCMGGNHQGQNPNGEPFRDVDYGSTTPINPPIVGAYFDCAKPVNDSVRNTGLTNLPPARAADMYYGYQRSSTGAIPAGGGLAPMGGPIYRYDEELESDTKFPEYFDGKPFFYEWARNKMYSIQLKDPAAGQGSQVEKVNPFLPNIPFLAPIDSKFGPDGSMYVLDWGGGYGRDNPTSGLYRIDYISGSRSPVARIDATPDSGQAPLEVTFDASRSSDPEGEDITYEWDFDGDGEVDDTGVSVTHTYTENGEYDARLTVTDPAGKTGTTTAPITVGNTRPVVAIETPPDGAFFDFGDEVSWEVDVTDPEDTTIDPQRVEVQPALGHDDHAHPLVAEKGLTGSTVTSIGGHAPDENIFYAIDARYTDTGGEGGANELLGSDTAVIFPKLRQAEWFDAKSDTATLAPGRDAAGGGQVVVGKDGAWVRFEPVSFHQIETFNLRVQAAAAGGTIELRDGGPTGELLGTAEVPATGQQFRDVAVDVSELGDETFDLHLVFTGSTDIKLNFFEAMGQGISPEAKPLVAITAPVDGTRVDPGDEVTVEAEASDADGSIAKVEFFEGDTKVGEDTSAPFSTTWTAPDEEGLYEITAQATDDDGNTTTSRLVQVQVGELFGDLVPFSNVGGEFERLGAGAFRISGAGMNAWQGTDEYSTLFQPAGGDDEYDAIVRVDASSLQNNSGKAGLIIRNDMTQPGSSPGYAMLAWRRAAGMEFLTDPDGNGQLNASVAGGTSTAPKWLKLSRRGEQVSAYWSNNGTSWTQVGGAVTLAGIAETQDVGMFIMAHEAAVRTADFSEFSIDSDPQDEEPPAPSEPLTCVGGPLSDEFDSPAVLDKWSLRNVSGSPVTQSDGQLHLPVTAGDINEDSSGPVSFAGQPLPSGDWAVETKIDLDHTSHWQWAGLVVHQSDDEYNKLAFVRHQNGTRFVEFQSETGGTRTTPGAPTLPGNPATLHLRLTNTDGTLTAAYSVDGSVWTDVAGSTALKTGAGTRIGLMAAGDVGDGTNVAHADWFRVTPDADEVPETGPNDEFDGTELDGCLWAESVRYNSNTASVAGGHLQVETEPGDINGNNPVQPRNFILQDAPEGDWVAETKLKAPLKHRYQLAGLLMYGDDDNYAKADIVAYNNPGAALDLRAELAAEKGGNGVGGGDAVNIPDTTESGYWWVQVTKVGTTYTAAVKSTAGASWTPIGDGITYDGPLNSLGLMAIGPEQEEPVTVEFDYFHLDTGEEPAVDETAPVTTASQTAVEDGVQVTLTATDETDGSGVDSTEYRIDEGEWTAYTAPFTISEPGTYTVEFRSTDVAGNEETVKSIEVVVEAADTDAPTTEITWDPGTADGEEGWYVTSPSFTLTAGDGDGSGVATTEYRINDGAWTAYEGEVEVPDGEHTIAYRSTDEAGNEEDAQQSEVSVDTVTPATGATQEKADEGVEVVLTATDATSGVATTEYRVDGGSWTEYADPVVVTGAGEHTVEFRSTDVAGNVEEVESITVEVDGAPADTTAPVTTVRTAPAAPNGTGGWFTTAVTVTLSATDADSGVARTEYRTGNGMWTTYTAPFALTAQGLNGLEVRSIDEAGNVEAAQSSVVAIDSGKPTVGIAGIRARTYPSHKATTVAWFGTDATSGIGSVHATLDGTPVEPGEWGMWTLSTGRHELTVTATDKAGNSASETVVFRVQATGKSLKKVVRAIAEDGEIGPKLANRLLQLEKDAAKAERKGERREARKHLKKLRKVVRKKLDGELRAALLAQVKERLARI